MTMGHNIYINDYHKLIEHSGRMVKVANCESTSPGFECTLVPLVTCVRALNKFSLKSTCSCSPSHIIRYQLNWG